jgi:hypothetical protein
VEERTDFIVYTGISTPGVGVQMPGQEGTNEREYLARTCASEPRWRTEQDVILHSDDDFPGATTTKERQQFITEEKYGSN